MAITTIGEVKTLLRIPADDTSKDSQITLLIDTCEADYLRIRNKPFDTDSKGGAVYPAGAALTIAQMIAFHLAGIRRTGLDSHRLGDHSAAFKDTVQGYPASITRKIRRYVRFV